MHFLWRQWSALGVAGGSWSKDNWIIDPESLLVFSIEMTRYEPRLFDEILDWLVVNGKWIDIQRLRGIVKNRDIKTQRILSAVASYVFKEAKSYSRKWQTISTFKRELSETKQEALFITKKGVAYPQPQNESDIFSCFGFIRETFTLRKMSRPVSDAVSSNIRFLLRALFGIGSRAECILFLLTHEAGHPSEVSEAIGVSIRAAQDMLIELSTSGLINTRIKGKRKIEYWLSQKKWWEFLYGMNIEEIKLPVWLNWIALFSALISVWNVICDIENTDSDYLRSSKLREAMDVIGLEFSKSGLDLPLIPGRNIRPEKYEEEFQKFISEVLGARVETIR